MILRQGLLIDNRQQLKANKNSGVDLFVVAGSKMLFYVKSCYLRCFCMKGSFAERALNAATLCVF